MGVWKTLLSQGRKPYETRKKKISSSKTPTLVCPSCCLGSSDSDQLDLFGLEDFYVISKKENVSSS